MDADTGTPIEGVVVLGVWNKEKPNVAGSNTTFHDAKETVTDSKGEFRVEGLGLKVFSFVTEMKFVIFKAGYTYESGYWASLKEGLYLKKKVKWEGEKPIIPLKRLTVEERKIYRGPSDPPDAAPLNKVINMLREIDKNDAALGLETRGIWNGETYE